MSTLRSFNSFTILFMILHLTRTEDTDDIRHNRIGPTKLGLDEIFVINLKRRPERLSYMNQSLRELGIQWKAFEAVDGRQLTKKKMQELGVSTMKNYTAYNPYFEREQTQGEVGCFLSHWFVWKEMVQRNLETVLILEDDVSFQWNFHEEFAKLMEEARSMMSSASISWDLIYIGRDRLLPEEFAVEGSNIFVHPKVSWGGYAYMLRLTGAKKLLERQILANLLPVDHYLPIMFGQPEGNPMDLFKPHNLVALATRKCLIRPRFINYDDEGYSSDTSDSSIEYIPESSIFEDLSMAPDEISKVVHHQDL